MDGEVSDVSRQQITLGALLELNLSAVPLRFATNPSDAPVVFGNRDILAVAQLGDKMVSDSVSLGAKIVVVDCLGVTPDHLMHHGDERKRYRPYHGQANEDFH